MSKKASPKEKSKGGRPSTYSDAIAERICDMVANGVPLIQVCEAEDMPDRTTVRRWRAANNTFRLMYAQAREEFADSLADELLKLADESREGVKVKDGPNGQEVTTGDMVERTRLQIETRKWLASKILPKKYGDKLDVTSDGKELGPTTIVREIIHKKA